MEKLIIDTDFETDCDDAGALAILHGLADRGLIEPLGIVASVNSGWPAAGYLVRPEQFKIGALPQMFRKDFLYSLNFMFLFFCVKHFCVLLDKNFGAYHHQFSTRRLRLSVCHIC